MCDQEEQMGLVASLWNSSPFFIKSPLLESHSHLALTASDWTVQFSSHCHCHWSCHYLVNKVLFIFHNYFKLLHQGPSHFENSLSLSSFILTHPDYWPQLFWAPEQYWSSLTWWLSHPLSKPHTRTYYHETASFSESIISLLSISLTPPNTVVWIIAHLYFFSLWKLLPNSSLTIHP